MLDNIKSSFFTRIIFSLLCEKNKLKFAKYNNSLKEKLDMTRLSGYAIWLAHYTGATQDDPFAKPSDYEGKYIMWQYTDKAIVDGITGKVDANVPIPNRTKKL